MALTHGKGAWAIFAAGRDFFPTLVQLGHRGISVVHVVFDRALYAPLRRHFAQHLELSTAQVCASDSSSVQGDLLPLLQWFVSSGCGNHDVHNSLKWAFHAHFQNTGLLHDVFVVIESLRNSYTQLHDLLWAMANHSFDLCGAGALSGALHLMWTSLGIEPEWVDSLTELGLLWQQWAPASRGQCCRRPPVVRKGRRPAFSISGSSPGLATPGGALLAGVAGP